MDNGTPKRVIIIDPAGLPVNARVSDDPKLSMQYMPFRQVMENIAKQKTASSSPSEQSCNQAPKKLSKSASW